MRRRNNVSRTAQAHVPRGTVSRTKARPSKAVCQALSRSDGSVTLVSNCSNVTAPFPINVVKALRQALSESNNSTVALELHVGNLLLDDKQTGQKLTCGANHLLRWLEQAPPSLRIFYMIASNDSLESLFVDKILQAMKSIPNLQKFYVDLHHRHLRALADFLTKSPTVWRTIERLHLAVSDGILAGELDARAAAVAISALHGLKIFTLGIDDYGAVPLLWALSQSSPLMLQEIRLLFPEGTTLSGDVADALASVVTSSKQLQNVEISHCRCIYDPGVWRTITTAFRSNLAIKRLRLYNVVFSSDATTAFLDGMQTDQHSIRQLRLSKCQFRMYPQTTGLDFANMVCGAMLEHVELDHGVLSPGQVASFFATLSTNASTVRLRSMVVELLFDSTMLHPVEYLAPFVASTIHLESLTICICTNRSSDDDLLLSVPITALLTSMKSNASLREIKVFRKQDRQPAIRADAWRRIDAFTKRNRMLQVGLANVPQDLLHNTARRRMRPVLCRVALQASNRPDHETVAVLLALSTIM